MHNALVNFESSITQTRALFDVHQYLENEVRAPMDFDDLLRAQIVYAVSAFDKLMHDLVRIGIIEIFKGTRSETPKYSNEPFSISVFQQMSHATIPPPEYYFEQAVIQKLRIVSYQDPQKVADGLSYIWPEKQKWQLISASMGSDHHTVKTRLKLIADRRNMIVHESDITPLNTQKQSISLDEVSDIIDFLEKCGRTIHSLVN